MEELLSFQSFQTAEEAETLIKLLRENDIYCELGKTKPILDRVIVGESFEDRFFVKIAGSDFKKADTLLESVIRKNLQSLPADYYLYSFTTEELQRIVREPDEWSRQDYVLAKELLEKRTDLTEEEMRWMKNQRVEALRQPEKGKMDWIIMGYVFSLLHCLIGLGFGLTYLTNKKIMPDGQKVFTYDQATRNHGRNMIVISALIIVAAIASQQYFLVIFGLLLFPLL